LIQNIHNDTTNIVVLNGQENLYLSRLLSHLFGIFVSEITQP